ncbi:MAG: hypothetical protein F4X54_07750 [Chloroflexi bacterium]|nr:hypothetical protein [Chloroflexota bacterium]MYB84610.1 hypothetical protein [Chloroflexota bacterium]
MFEHETATGAAHQGDADGVAELVERAFQYRGDVTVHTDDGGTVTGYLFNRDTRASEPFVQLFETQTGREVSVPYRSIADVLFTGRDAAAAADQRFEALQTRSGTERHGD